MHSPYRWLRFYCFLINGTRQNKGYNILKLKDGVKRMNTTNIFADIANPILRIALN